MSRRAAQGADADEDWLPLKALLHRKNVSASELVLLQTAVEHCSDGSTIWASVGRMAVYSKLSRRKVQTLLREFEQRRWFTMIAPANCKKNLPATYRLNLHAIPDDTRMEKYIRQESQQVLPGVSRRPIPGERIPDPRAATAQGPLRSHCAPPCAATAHAQPLRPILNTKPVDDDAVGVGVAMPEQTQDVVVGLSFSTQDPRAATAQGGLQKVDRAAIRAAVLEILPMCDEKALDRIIQGCLREQGDATSDEIVHFVRERGGQVSSGRITNPIGFLITAVPECFVGEAFEQWRNLRAAAAERRQHAAAEVPAEVLGWCKGCSRPRFASIANSRWTATGFCAEGCERDYEQRKASAAKYQAALRQG